MRPVTFWLILSPLFSVAEGVPCWPVLSVMAAVPSRIQASSSVSEKVPLVMKAGSPATVTVQVAFRPPSVSAVIVAVPLPTAVTIPYSTVATFSSLEYHLERLTSPSTGVAIMARFSVRPGIIVIVCLFSLMDSASTPEAYSLMEMLSTTALSSTPPLSLVTEKTQPFRVALLISSMLEGVVKTSLPCFHSPGFLVLALSETPILPPHRRNSDSKAAL